MENGLEKACVHIPQRVVIDSRWELAGLLALCLSPPRSCGDAVVQRNKLEVEREMRAHELLPADTQDSSGRVK
jgi:hypothetical protein